MLLCPAELITALEVAGLNADALLFTFRAKSRFVFGREPFAALLTNAVVNPRNRPAVAAIATNGCCELFCFALGGGIVTGRQIEKLRILTAEVGQVAADILVFAVGKHK